MANAQLAWVDPDAWAMALLMLSAVLCSAIVAIERAGKEKLVGFRTLTLVGLDVAIVTMGRAAAKIDGRGTRALGKAEGHFAFPSAGEQMRL